jgi:hypothetical protein
MAGHRRTRNPGRPLQRRTRADNRRKRLDERMAAAHSPLERVTAAMEYFRSALAAVPHDLAAPVANALAQHLIDRGHELHAANLRRTR